MRRSPKETAASKAEDSQPRRRPTDPSCVRAGGTRKGSARLEIKVLLALCAVLLIPASAWAYRPFVATDAAVADPREVEIELGYFTLRRSRRGNTIATPSMVLNYGFAKRLELVGEFRLEVSPEVEITD